MQTLTLPELVNLEGIPDKHAIFRFRRENGKGIIEFEFPPGKEVKPPISSAEVLKRLQALQFDIGRPTNSVKIIRSLRRERYPRRSKLRTQTGRGK